MVKQEIKVYFPDDTYKKFLVSTSKTTLEKVWNTVCTSLDLPESEMDIFFFWLVTPEFEYLLYTDDTLETIESEFERAKSIYGTKDKSSKKKSKEKKSSKSSKSSSKSSSITQTIARTVSLATIDKIPRNERNFDSDEKFRIYFKPTAVLPLSREQQAESESALNIFYYTAVNNVYEGNYPLPVLLTSQLAAIDYFVKNGPMNANSIEELQDTITDYLPPVHKYNLGEKKLSPQEWTKEIMKFYSSISSKNPNKRDAMRQYLSVCRRWPYYGSTFFKGKMLKEDKSSKFFRSAFDGEVLFGINQIGIHIIDPIQMKALSCTYQQLFDVDYPGEDTLLLKVKSSDGTPSELAFRIPQADLLTNLYDNWLDELDFIATALKEYQTLTVKRDGKTSDKKSKAPQLSKKNASSKDAGLTQMFSTKDLGTVCEEQPIAGNPKLKLRQLNLVASYSTFNFFQDENAEPIPESKVKTIKRQSELKNVVVVNDDNKVEMDELKAKDSTSSKASHKSESSTNTATRKHKHKSSTEQGTVASSSPSELAQALELHQENEQEEEIQFEG